MLEHLLCDFLCISLHKIFKRNIFKAQENQLLECLLYTFRLQTSSSGISNSPGVAGAVLQTSWILPNVAYMVPEIL